MHVKYLEPADNKPLVVVHAELYAHKFPCTHPQVIPLKHTMNPSS